MPEPSVQAPSEGIRLIRSGHCPRGNECGGFLNEVDTGTLQCDTCERLYAKPEDRPWEREE